MSNYDEVRQMLQEMELNFDEEEMEDHVKLLRFGLEIEPQGSVLILFAFDPEETYVDTEIWDILQVKTPEKRKKAIALLNDLNSKYRFWKFVIDKDGDISCHHSLSTEDGFNAEIPVEISKSMVSAVEKAYASFQELA